MSDNSVSVFKGMLGHLE